MSKTTTSTISRTLPDFPYSPAPAARNRLSALLSSSHFVTTLVSPPHHPSSPSVGESPSSSPPDPADQNQENTDFFSAPVSPVPASPSQSFQPSLAPPEHFSVPVDPLLSQSLKQPLPKQPLPSAGSSKRPFSFLSARRLQSSKPSPSSTPILKESTSALIEARDRGSLTRRRRCKSSWRHFKRMGNRLATPFRTLGICITGSAVAFSDDPPADASSLGSPWYSSGEYSPEYIRAVLENNVLLGHLTVDCVVQVTKDPSSLS